jgi:MOSC domain-containing protein YiiM
VMPREGIFCIVATEGQVRAGDQIHVISRGTTGAE